MPKLVGLAEEEDAGDAAGRRIDIGDGLCRQQGRLHRRRIGNSGLGRTALRAPIPATIRARLAVLGRDFLLPG